MQISEKIDACRICRSDLLVEVLDLGTQPPANSLRRDRSEKLPEIPLVLLFCKTCSTVQLSHTVNPDYLFDHYLWVTGTSSAAREYSKLFCDRVMDRIGDTQDQNPFVVEIASNDGTFLKRFIDWGCDVLGVDPAKNLAAMAERSGVPTVAEFFDKSVAARITAEHQSASAVIARNVLPHVKEIHSIVSGIGDLIGDSGLGVIEFHYAQRILEELHYDSVYHEHLFYFSLKTMGGMLDRYGLKIFDVERSPISGGSLVIYFTKSDRPKSRALIELEEQEERLGLNDLETWSRFARSCQDHANQLVSLIKDATETGLVIGYGASARSSTLLNFCGITAQQLKSVIDKNELKQGLITPGSDIDIMSLENAATRLSEISTIVILAWNFESEIKSELVARGFAGSFILPLPNNPRLEACHGS